MNQRARRSGPRTTPRGQCAEQPPGPERATDAPDDLLDLLGDNYAREAIDALRCEPMSGAEVAEATSMSQPTAFRRLNELAELGLVGVRRRIDPDGGHHRKEYYLVIDSLSVSLGGEDLAVAVEASDADPDPGVASARSG